MSFLFRVFLVSCFYFFWTLNIGIYLLFEYCDLVLYNLVLVIWNLNHFTLEKGGVQIHGTTNSIIAQQR